MYGSDTDDEANTRRVIEAIERAGWKVGVMPLGLTTEKWDEGGVSVEAESFALIARREDEERAKTAATPYLAACELAERCGIDLRDG